MRERGQGSAHLVVPHKVLWRLFDSHAPLLKAMSSSTSNCVRPKDIDWPIVGDKLFGHNSEH